MMEGESQTWSAVLSEPQTFCNKKQTPYLHTFWPLITLVCEHEM